MTTPFCLALSILALAAPPDSASRPAPLAFRAVATLEPRADGRGRLLEPSGVATDPFGRVTVADAASHRLQRWSAEGEWLDEAGALGDGVQQFRRPTSVARLGSLGVAVLDVENRRVVSYDIHGRVIGVLVDLDDASLEDAAGRVTPVALAADRGGAMFVADAGRDRLLAFDFSGRFVREIGGFGARPGSFRGLSGVATAPRGEILTTERPREPARGAKRTADSSAARTARVQRLDADGRPIASWTTPALEGTGAIPIAVDDSSRVAVADEASGRMWLFARDGRLLAAVDGLEGPRALAFAPDGSLLVAEAPAGRVRRFVLAGARAGGD